MHPSRSIGSTLRALALACAVGAAPTPAAAQTGGPAAAGVVEEARAFMEAYGRDLAAGNRAALAARYDRSGAYFLGSGRKDFMPYDSIVALYAGPGWSPPKSFEWRDLSFEPVGPDAVVVAGRFLWGLEEGQPPMLLSYTALLRRRDGALRIRLEDESAQPVRRQERPLPDGRGRR